MRRQNQRQPFTGSEVKRFKGSGFSPAADLKSGQSNRKRNFEKANIEYRIMNVESSFGGQVSKGCILSI
jgi:hypothetical protein